MKKEDCFELGVVVKPHGLNGELKIKLDVDDPSDYMGLAHVFIEVKRELAPFFVETIVSQNELFIVKLEEVDTIEAAEALRGATLWLPDSELPELPEDSFYYHEIIGLTVEDLNMGTLGKVSNAYTDISQPLIEMQYQGKEVLIPANPAVVLRVDRAKEVLHVDLPDGLLELYLTEDPGNPSTDD